MTIPARRIVIFLGAGASAKAGVPPTFEFVEAFRRDLLSRTVTKNPTRKVDPKLLTVLDQLLRVLRRWRKRTTPSDDRIDVELLLDALTIAGSLNDQVASALHYGYPVAVAGKKRELDSLLKLLQRFVREKCYVGLYAAEYLGPLIRFLKANKPVHVFTVNYDLVMEQFLERSSRQFTDGFDLYWNPSKFLDDRYEVYLYKLHGSVTWYRSPDGRSLKLPIRLTQTQFMMATGGVAQPLMLYPAQKWVNSGVYLRLLSLLHETLSECEYVFVIGYSFRDDHFVRAFQEAAWANPKLWIILVGPRAEEVYNEKLRWVKDSPSQGAMTRSELTGRVVRVPFVYERVIGSLYTIIWGAIADAINSDALALSQSEGGGDVRWHEIALKYLEAGQLERPIELEEAGIDWTKAGTSYPLDFYGRKAILLAILGHPDEAAAAWSRFDAQTRSWLQVQLSFEFLGDWGIRLSFAKSNHSAKTGDQIAQDIAGLTSFARRYTNYLEGEENLASPYVRSIMALSEYLRSASGSGIPYADYIRSRVEQAETETKTFEAEVQKLRSEGKSAAETGPLVVTQLLSVERAFQSKKVPFLAPRVPPLV